MNWLKENFKWLKWIFGAIWTAIIFFVGNYFSYVKMRAEMEIINEKVNMILKTNENIEEQFNIVIQHLLNQ